MTPDTWHLEHNMLRKLTQAYEQGVEGTVDPTGSYPRAWGYRLPI